MENIGKLLWISFQKTDAELGAIGRKTDQIKYLCQSSVI